MRGYFNKTEVWVAVLPLPLYSVHVFLLLPWAGSNQYTTAYVYVYSLHYIHACMQYSSANIFVTE